MANPVGFRFHPSDEEIFDHYLRLKNLGGYTIHIDEVISTVNICSFDPWDLPSKSMMQSIDGVWYFFGRKEKRYNRGDRQSRTTKSGFWKKTGVTRDIMRKGSGNREKIGEKRVLVFHLSKILGGSKSDWGMHEYVATFLSPPNQMTTYTFCKVKFKGEERYSGVIEHPHSLITTHLNNSGGFSTGSEGSSFDCLHTQELENPRQFSGFLDVQEEAPVEDAMCGAINNLSTDDWKSWLNHDGEDQGDIMFVQEDRNDYTPKKSLTGVFIGHSSDDSDSDSISAITSSIQTSSTCDSFGSSNRRTYKIKDMQESPSSTIKLMPLTQEVSKSLGTIIDTSEMKNSYDDVQEAEMGEYKMGQQEIIKNKRASLCYRIIQKIRQENPPMCFYFKNMI